MVERDQRRRLDPDQPRGISDDIGLRRRRVVGQVIRARWPVPSGDHAIGQVIDMNAAENLPRHIDAVSLPRRHAVERRAPGAVNPRQAKRPGAHRQPCRIRLCPRRAPAAAGGGTLIHPRPAGVAINPGRGQVSEVQATEQLAIALKYRIACPLRRHGGQHMARRRQRPRHPFAIIEPQRAILPVARRRPRQHRAGTKAPDDISRRISHAEND